MVLGFMTLKQKGHGATLCFNWVEETLTSIASIAMVARYLESCLFQLMISLRRGWCLEVLQEIHEMYKPP